MLKWKFKTLVKLIISVFVVSTCLVHYQNEKYERTSEILRGIGNRSAKELVQPFTDTFLINNHWLKENNNKEETDPDALPSSSNNNNNDINFQVEQVDQEPFLTVVITSQPSNYERRDLIRNSWMKYRTERSLIVVFFCGKSRPPHDMEKLQKESEKHGDIIVDDFEESYYGLTVKTLRIFKWFTMNLPKSNFLLKTDDDVYVNTPNFIQYLVNVQLRLKQSPATDTVQNYLGGSVVPGRSPHTINTFSKWYVPPKLWKEQVTAIAKLTKDRSDNHRLSAYPPYLEGNFYVISGHTVPFLLNTSLQLPLFHLEDVYVTGFLASEILGIELSNIPNISTESAMFPRFNYKYKNIFKSLKDIIAYHCDNEIDLIKDIYEESLSYLY